MNLRIGFNLVPYSTTGSEGGAGVFIHNLALACQKYQNKYECEFVLYVNKENEKIYHKKCKDLEICALSLPSNNKMLRKIQDQMLIYKLIKKKSVDILVCNYVMPYFLPIPCVVVIHDIVSFVFPKTVRLFTRFWHKIMIVQSLKKADGILTVSQFSAGEIKRVFPWFNRNIFICSEGVDYKLEEVSVDVYNLSIDGINTKLEPYKYVLAVGHMHSAKNVKTLIKSFHYIAEKRKDIKLAITGNTFGRWSDILNMIKEFRLEQQIVHLGYVSRKELCSLYKYAACYCMPSIYEGFGLPLIEAQYLKCPVVCSNCASLPEVAGEGALYFNPNDPKDVSEKLLEVITNQDLRKKLIEKGLRNQARYSWERLLEEIMCICKSIIQKGDPSFKLKQIEKKYQPTSKIE